ncbi:MAG: DUF493 domain-containing protein [Dysgonamonadaceae bacterium]
MRKNMLKDKIEILGDKDENQSVEDFYAKFREKLLEAQTFPSNYIYKFIVPADQAKIALIHAVFENAKVSFASRDSKTGKYTSLTIILAAKSADEIIEYYKEVATIPGVVML